MKTLQLLLYLLTLLLSCRAYAELTFQIFILHSYSQEYPWTKSQHNAFTKTIRVHSDEASLISTEYLDTKRKKYDATYASMFFNYLQDKYANYEPDVIYVTDDNALSFALEHFNHLFKNAPIIFSGVNDYSAIERIETSRVTGVFEKKEISPNLQLLKIIDPNQKDILLVGDASNTYQAIENEIKTELKQHPDINASFVAYRHIDELINAISEHNVKYIFLTTLGGITDEHENNLTLKQTISRVVQSRQNIILSMEDAYLYKGVLGGYVTSGHSQGKTAANIALDIRKGTPVNLIPPITQSPNEYIFEYEELKKNSISLPESIVLTAKILHTPLSFYERNRILIMGSTIGMAVLLIISMSIFMILLTRKNRKIESDARTREKLVEQINEHSKQLEAEQRKLNQAQTIAHIGNYTWDVNENKTTWSDELFRITKQDPMHFKPSYDGYVSCIHPEDRNKFLALTKKALAEPGHYSAEYRIAHPDGEVRYVFEEGEVLMDKSMNITSLVGVIHDITEHKVAEAEQNRLQRELAQARKMEALGKLTGGIAHDFNNMLAIIVGYIDLTLDRYRNTLEPAMLGYLENIEHASYRARDLVSKMMVFSRSGKNESKALHLDLAVQETIEMLRSIIPSSINIDLDYEDNLPKVIMDTVQLQQILMNLCINAKDAMNGKGTLGIHLGWRRGIDNECFACHKHIHGDWIDLSISDTGCGMTPDIIEHIFEPFFTTKEVGLGTGMGMSILQAIVDTHHGHILINTAINQGTTFHLLFPPVIEHSDKQATGIEEEYSSEHYGHGERILIVDDEKMLADFIAEMLNSHGYHCTVYTRSPDALEHFQNQSKDFDLLITDQTMPKLTGIEMITQMRKILPDFPAILMTGYSEMIDKHKADKMGINIFLNKPINSTQLLQFVAEILKPESGRTI